MVKSKYHKPTDEECKFITNAVMTAIIKELTPIRDDSISKIARMRAILNALSIGNITHDKAKEEILAKYKNGKNKNNEYISFYLNIEHCVCSVLTNIVYDDDYILENVHPESKSGYYCLLFAQTAIALETFSVAHYALDEDLDLTVADGAADFLAHMDNMK